MPVLGTGGGGSIPPSLTGMGCQYHFPWEGNCPLRPPSVTMVGASLAPDLRGSVMRLPRRAGPEGGILACRLIGKPWDC